MPVYDTLWSCSRLLPDCPHCWYSSVWVTTFLSECYQSTQSPQQNYQLRVQDDILPLRQHGNTCNVPTAIHVLYLQKYMYCTYSNTCTVPTAIQVLYLQQYMYCTYRNTCTVPTEIHVLYLQQYMYYTYSNTCTVPTEIHVLYLQQPLHGLNTHPAVQLVSLQKFTNSK